MRASCHCRAQWRVRIGGVAHICGVRLTRTGDRLTRSSVRSDSSLNSEASSESDHNLRPHTHQTSASRSQSSSGDRQGIPCIEQFTHPARAHPIPSQSPPIRLLSYSPNEQLLPLLSTTSASSAPPLSTLLSVAYVRPPVKQGNRGEYPTAVSLQYCSPSQVQWDHDTTVMLCASQSHPRLKPHPSAPFQCVCPSRVGVPLLGYGLARLLGCLAVLFRSVLSVRLAGVSARSCWATPTPRGRGVG